MECGVYVQASKHISTCRMESVVLLACHHNGCVLWLLLLLQFLNFKHQFHKRNKLWSATLRPLLVVKQSHLRWWCLPLKDRQIQEITKYIVIFWNWPLHQVLRCISLHSMHACTHISARCLHSEVIGVPLLTLELIQSNGIPLIVPCGSSFGPKSVAGLLQESTI